MTSNQRKLLKQWALATLGAGAVGVSLFFGGFDEKTQRPTPIVVDGETIEFTWTDDNTDEDLLIYTDQQTYTDGFSEATVYVAVTNQSGVAQDVELQGYFVNQRRHIKDIEVLTTATFASTSTEPQNCQERTGAQIQKFLQQGYDPDDYFITETTVGSSTPRIFDVCSKLDVVTYATSTEWVPLPMKLRDIYEVAKEEEWLSKQRFTRKAVEGYIAENKSFPFPIAPGKTMYYRLQLEYPANDEGNFYLEAIGSEGAYGHLDPWFDASWDYRVEIEVNPSYVDGSADHTNFPVYIDLADLPAGFHTNVKSDGCDIRVVESDETTETAFELVDYDSTGDTGELHFLADSLSYNATSTFYIYYGNSAASCYATNATYGAENVWTDYEGVWHMQEDPSGSAPQITDSTSGSSDLTSGGSMVTGDLVAGQLGNSIDFDGVNDQLNVNDGTTFQPDTDDMTISFWGYILSAGVSREPVFWKGVDTGSGFGTDWYHIEYDFGGDGKMGWGIDDSSAFDSLRGADISTSYTLNDWTQWHAVRDASTNMKMYQDGSEVGSVNKTSGDVSPTGLFRIGGNYNGDYSNIRVDEVRWRRSVLSADWVGTEYNNQNTPEPFYWVGDEESNGGGAARRIIRTTGN